LIADQWQFNLFRAILLTILQFIMPVYYFLFLLHLVDLLELIEIKLCFLSPNTNFEKNKKYYIFFLTYHLIKYAKFFALLIRSHFNE